VAVQPTCKASSARPDGRDRCGPRVELAAGRDVRREAIGGSGGDESRDLTGRCPENPVKIVPRLDERGDRRRVRRALSGDELARLLATTMERPEIELRTIRRGKNKGKLKDDIKPVALDMARRRGRERRLVYLTAAMTGLRRGELGKLMWSDVDLESGSIRVRIGVGKAKREDVIPLHTQLLAELVAYRPQGVEPSASVFKSIPLVRTFYADLQAARDDWLDEAADAHEREQREGSDFLKRTDREGRVVDFHAMRTTLGTTLAQHGVAP